MRLVDVPIRVIFAENDERRPRPMQTEAREKPRRPSPSLRAGLPEPRSAAADPKPAAFQRGGPTYRIARIVDRWRYVGRWWVGEGEWRFIKVETTDGGLFELCFDVAADEWRLYRIYD